ncbi:MAG: hydroxysqualene dehydroxylase HpnE [bacterium]|nr:hydroxysqualene dehydroxylase HpnE [bacterium]
MSRVLIVGAGFAGLAAAVHLAERGVEVTVLERRKHLGGRAYSFSDRLTGDTVDNGQHLFMRCYDQTLDFLSRIGTTDRLCFQNSFHIDFSDPKLGRTSLSFPRNLPPPFNLLAGFARYRPAGWRDALRLRKLAIALNSPVQPGLSVDQWLNTCGQSSRIRRAFWDPLCISALNQPPASASAEHLAEVLRRAFVGPPDGACLGYAGVGLRSLYTDAARDFVQQHGGQCHTGAPVTTLKISPSGPVHVCLKSGEQFQGDALICAIPPPALSRLIPDALASLRKTLKAFRPSPILSVNLWLDRSVMEEPFLGLLDARMDWVFNKAALYAGRDRASEGHLTLVASAAHALVDRTDEELVHLALEDLRTHIPAARNTTLRHSRVVRERRATFALPLHRPYPANQTDLPRFILAGDWTDTGLPATIEGAVLSGNRAAALALDVI